MSRYTKTLTSALVTASVALGGLAGANAGTAVPLSDRQLDNVTAGSAITFGSAVAQATGLITMAGTASNSAIGSTASVEDGFGSEGGVTVGSAVAYGSN